MDILLIGSPGSGKTMLARRAPGLMPPLTRAEALEVTRIHSAAGLLTARGTLTLAAPYRTPHHTVSDAGLIGGGSVPRPGEVSLAHRGLLFLDEFPEFSRKALETLRQPLEDGTVTISRARASVEYPARFQLIAAMNPCPCGHLGDPEKACTCTPLQRTRYAARLSGPLLDRIDLVVRVPRLTVDELTRAPEPEGSATVRARITAARDLMLARQGGRNTDLAGQQLRRHAPLHPGPDAFLRAAARQLGLTGRGFDRVLRVARTVADLAGQQLRRHAPLNPGPDAFLRAAARQLGLTGRGFDRVLRVARTVADLAGSHDIRESHLAEAVTYRPRDLT